MNPAIEQLARYIRQELEKGDPEPQLRAALIQHGWAENLVNDAFAAARQYMSPEMAAGNTLLPRVSPQSAAPQPSPLQNAMPLATQLGQPPAAASPAAAPPSNQLQNQPLGPNPGLTRAPAFPQSSVQSPASPYRDVLQEPKSNHAKSFAILAIVAAVLLAIGLGSYLVLSGLKRAEDARVARDAERRNDLSLLLNDLSDYYVAHSSYPTRDQLNNEAFLRTNQFDTKATSDPAWTAKDAACVKDNKPVFADTAKVHCYAYEAFTAESGVCTAAGACPRMQITITLEKEKQPYTVIFQQNAEVDP